MEPSGSFTNDTKVSELTETLISSSDTQCTPEQDRNGIHYHSDRSADLLDHQTTVCSDQELKACLTVEQVISTTNTKDLYKCDSCGKVIQGSYSLKVHLLKHLEKARRSILSKKSSGSSNCSNDNKQVRPVKPPIIRSTPRDHGLLADDKEKPFCCDICGHSFKHMNYLRQHMYKHNGQKCKYCGKGFASKTSLSWHIRSHEGIMNFKCVICDKTFVSKERLKQHINQIHDEEEKDYCCNLCQKVFKRSYLLKRHLAKHNKMNKSDTLKQEAVVDNVYSSEATDINNIRNQLSDDNLDYNKEEMNTVLENDIRIDTERKQYTDVGMETGNERSTEVTKTNKLIHGVELVEGEHSTQDAVNWNSPDNNDLGSNTNASAEQNCVETSKQPIGMGSTNTSSHLIEPVSEQSAFVLNANGTLEREIPNGGQLIREDSQTAAMLAEPLLHPESQQEGRRNMSFDDFRNEESHRYRCSLCQKLFSTEGNLQRHYTLHSRESTTYALRNDQMVNVSDNVPEAEEVDRNTIYNQATDKQTAEGLNIIGHQSQQYVYDKNQVVENTGAFHYHAFDEYKQTENTLSTGYVCVQADNQLSASYVSDQNTVSGTDLTSSVHTNATLMQQPNAASNFTGNTVSGSSQFSQKTDDCITQRGEEIKPDEMPTQQTTDNCNRSDAEIHEENMPAEPHLPSGHKINDSADMQEQSVRDRIFKILNDYKRQVSEQAREKTHCCSICQRKLSSKSNLSRHLKTHAREMNTKTLNNDKEPVSYNKQGAEEILPNQSTFGGIQTNDESNISYIRNEERAEETERDIGAITTLTTESAGNYEQVESEMHACNVDIPTSVTDICLAAAIDSQVISWQQSACNLMGDQINANYLNFEESAANGIRTGEEMDLSAISQNQSVEWNKHTGSEFYNFAFGQASVDKSITTQEDIGAENKLAEAGLQPSKPTIDESKLYNCVACKKSFSTQNFLRRHSCVQSGENIHSCGTCGKLFSTKSNLNRHYKTHEKEVNTSNSRSMESDSKETVEFNVHDFHIQETDTTNHVVHGNDSDSPRDQHTTTDTRPLTGFETCDTLIIQSPYYSFGGIETTDMCNQQPSNNNDLSKEMHTGFTPNQLSVYTNEQSGNTIDIVSQHQQQTLDENSQSLETMYSNEISNQQPASSSDHTEDELKMIFMPDQESFVNIMMVSEPIQESNTFAENVSYTFAENVSNVFAENLPESDKPMKDTNKTHNCEVCHKVFENQTALKHHSSVHVNDKTHSCTTCGLMFGTAHDLKLHLKTHTGQTPKYVCDVCKKRWVHSFELKRHMVVHSDEKPHFCQHCDLRFKRAADLKRHTRKRHLEKNSDGGFEL